MRAEVIFAPLCVLAFWTGLVLFLTGFRRLRAVARGRAPAGAFRFGESAEVPTDVSLMNRNLMNLLEMPLLFYVVAIAIYVTHHVRPGAVALAWIYVGLRLVHSVIHVTYSRVRHRLIVFALSNFVLLAMWIGFASRVLGSSG